MTKSSRDLKVVLSACLLSLLVLVAVLAFLRAYFPSFFGFCMLAIMFLGATAVLQFTHHFFRLVYWASFLRRRGYSWMGFRDAGVLRSSVAEIHHTPFRTYLEAEIGYEHGNTDSVIPVLKRLGYDTAPELGSADERVDRVLAQFWLLAFAFLVSIPLLYWLTGGRVMFTLVGMLVIGGLLAVIYVAGSYIKLQSDLHRKGYWWASLWDANYLLTYLGKQASNLPPRDELCALPSYRDGDASTIVRLAIQRIDH